MQLGLLFQFWYYVPKNKNEEILSMFLYFFDFDTKSTICSCGRVRYPHRILSYSTNCHCHSKVRRSKQLPTSSRLHCDSRSLIVVLIRMRWKKRFSSKYYDEGTSDSNRSQRCHRESYVSNYTLSNDHA